MMWIWIGVGFVVGMVFAISMIAGVVWWCIDDLGDDLRF